MGLGLNPVESWKFQKIPIRGLGFLSLNPIELYGWIFSVMGLLCVLQIA